MSHATSLRIDLASNCDTALEDTGIISLHIIRPILADGVKSKCMIQVIVVFRFWAYILRINYELNFIRN